jgi:pilus assembly protein CpaE
LKHQNQNKGSTGIMSGKKIKIVIVDDIPEARENLKKLLAFEPDFEVVGTASTGREGLDVAKSTLPHVILMDINMPDMDGITAANELRRLLPSAGVVMMSVQGEAEYIRRAMAAGARDFLTKPTPAEELYATVRRVFDIQEQLYGGEAVLNSQRAGGDGKKATLSTGRETRVIAVYSATGGAGKTTIATNVATALMRENVKVLLVDCDLHFGDVSVFLNLKAQGTIVDLMSTVEDLDMDLVENLLANHESGLRVLVAPQRIEDADLVTPDKAVTLVSKLKGVFDFIVVDLPTGISDMALGFFDLADRILMVINPNLPAMKNTLSMLSVLDKLEYPPEKLVFTVNRVSADMERQKITIPVASIEAKLRKPALGVIPSDEKKFLYAVNRGVSVIAKDKTQSPAKELIGLADALYNNLRPEPVEPDAAPSASAQQPKSRLGRLFGG